MRKYTLHAIITAMIAHSFLLPFYIDLTAMRFVESPTNTCVVKINKRENARSFFILFFFKLLLHIFVSTLKYEQTPNTHTHYYNHGVNSIFTLAVLAVPDGRTRWKRRRFVVVSIVVFSYVRRQKRFQFDFERRRRIWKTFFEESFFRASRARGERTRRRRTTTTTTGTARVDDVVAHERLAESHVERSVRR